MARSRPRPKRRRRRARAALGKSRVSRGSRVRSCRGARGSCASWHVGEPRAVCHPQQSFKESSTRNIILIVLLNRPRKISGSAGPFSRVSHLLVEVSVLFIYLFASGCTRFSSFHCGVRPLSREIHFVKIFSLSFFLFLSARQSRDKRTVRLDTPKQPCFDGTLHRHLERKERQQFPRKGWEDGTPPPHRDFNQSRARCCG